MLSAHVALRARPKRPRVAVRCLLHRVLLIVSDESRTLNWKQNQRGILKLNLRFFVFILIYSTIWRMADLLGQNMYQKKKKKNLRVDCRRSGEKNHPKTRKRLKMTLFNQTKQDRARIFKEIIFFSKLHTIQKWTNNWLIFCQLDSSGRARARDCTRLPCIE